jgi:hypothetical protein
MSDPNDLSTFESVAIIQPENTSFNAYQYDLYSTTLSGANNHIAFRHNSNSSSWYYWLDDFKVELSPDCVEPANFEANNLTSNSIDLSWTELPTAPLNGYDIYLSTEATAPTEVSIPTHNTSNDYLIIDTLTEVTTYYVWLRANCDVDDVSVWTGPVTFTTPCEPETVLPYVENFDTYGTGSSAFPACWSRPVTYSSYPYIVSAQSASSPASLKFNSSTTTPTYAVSPAFAEDIHNLRVSFNLKAEGIGASQSGTMELGVMSDPYDLSTFESVAIIQPENTSFNAYQYDLYSTTLSGANNYIALRHNSNSSSWYYWLDDFKVELSPSCFEPTNIQASDITINSANISWTAATESPDATYHVYYSLVDAAPADDIDIAECEAPATNSIELTDLTSSSTYYVWVRSVCGADDFSTWAGPSVFSTSCAIISEYPYFEGFNSGIDPACWTIIDNDNSGDSWYSGTYASTPSYEGASMMVSEFSYPNDDWLISPQFKITSDNLKVDFYAKSYSAYYYESFNVLISKTGTSPSDFTIVLENIVDHPNTWQNHEYILSEHGINIDDEIYVAIQHVSNDQFVLFIDAFTVSEIEIPSAEAEILTYSIPNQVGDTEITSTETEGTITVTMPFGTEVTNLVADFTLSDGATAQVDTEDQASGVTPNNFTDPVVYVVTAEDGTTTKNWTVTVNLEAAPSSEAEILTYSLPNQVGEAEINSGATEGTITVTMPYDTEVANLVANFTLSYGATAKVGAIDQETGVTPNNFTDPVVYAVTAQDGSTIKNWTVTVNLEDAPSSEANILTYSFAEQYSPAVIDDVNHTVTVVVNEGTSLDALVATFTLSDGATAKIGAVDQESGVTENNFTDPVIYTVTAEDGTTTQPWTVTVSVYVGIEDVENSAIAIYPNPNNGNFTLDFTNINGKVNYQIYDTKGSIIISDDFVANGSAIKEVSLNLVPGVYFVRLVTETQSLVEKLVVE